MNSNNRNGGTGAILFLLTPIGLVFILMLVYWVVKKDWGQEAAAGMAIGLILVVIVFFSMIIASQIGDRRQALLNDHDRIVNELEMEREKTRRELGIGDQRMEFKLLTMANAIANARLKSMRTIDQAGRFVEEDQYAEDEAAALTVLEKMKSQRIDF